MRTIFFPLVLILSLESGVSAQPIETFLSSFDPNPQNIFEFDKGNNIWSVGQYIYVTNGYINPQDGGSMQIFKINANNRQIVKQINVEGPQGDIRYSEHGGFWITKDQHILIAGQWNDYTTGTTRAMLSKLDTNLNFMWTNYFPDIPTQGLYGDGVVETEAGDYLFYATSGLNAAPHTMAEIRIIKTDTAGGVIFNKMLPDTFDVSAGYGDITPTDDGNFLLGSVVLDYYNHPGKQSTVLFKLDAEANPLWSRALDFKTFTYQGGVSTALAGGGGAVMWMKDTSWYDNITVKPDFNIIYGISSVGDRTWAYEWHDYALRTVYRIIPARNGDILGVGYFRKAGALMKGRGWLFRMTSTGETIWEQYYSDSLLRPWSPQLELLDLCEMADGRIAASGIAFDTNALGYLNANIAVLVVDANGCLEPGCANGDHYITSVLEPLVKLPDLPRLTMSPNPVAYGPFTVTLPEQADWQISEGELRCYDLQGRLIRQVDWPKAASSQEIRGPDLNSGTYHLVLFSKNRPVASGKLIVQH